MPDKDVVNTYVWDTKGKRILHQQHYLRKSQEDDVDKWLLTTFGLSWTQLKALSHGTE